MQQHNGTIWIESQEGEGTTVLFALPSHTQQQSMKHFHEPTVQDKQGNYVMIVEDDLSLSNFIGRRAKK